MLIWVGLFIIIVLVSLILAIRSMRDYSEVPVHSSTPYSVYLVRNEQGLNDEILTQIDQIINQKRLIISFERLYKGTKRALVVYGPVIILKQFVDALDLMELEDYSLKLDKPLPPGILSWEISSYDFRKIIKPVASQGINEPVVNLSDIPLEDEEELWWQLVMQPKCERNGLQPLFKVLIRIVIIANNDNRAQDIKAAIDSLIKTTNLVSIPQTFSSAQIINFYQKRSLPQKLLDKEGGHFIVVVEDIKDLLGQF